jgi:CBS domain-containing protein
MLVRDVMSRPAVTVRADASLKEATTLLDVRSLTTLPVVDSEGRVLGIVSEADLIAGVADDPRAHERPVTIRPVTPPHRVDDIYTRSPIAIGPQDDVTAAVDVMAAKGFKSLPVVDHEGRLLGVISRSDVVRALARDDDVIAADIRKLFEELGHATWTAAVSGGLVEITGADEAADRSLAHALTRTVPGVVAVHIR